MGSIYDRNKKTPEKGPNIYIRFKTPTGKWTSRPVGHIKPDGLTKAQLKTKERDLRRLAKDVLTKVEGDIVLGRHGLADETRDTAANKLFKDAATDFVDRRKTANERDPMVHRAWRDDRCRVNKHLIPFFGSEPVGEIDTARVKAFIRHKRGKLARQTLVNCINLMSRMYNDMREEGEDVVNPVALLDRATRRAMGPPHDPKKTPYLRKKSDIRAMHLALSGPVQVMFDIAVFTGTRTGEVQALEARDVDLDRRRIRIERSVDGPVKDNDLREVLILDTLVEPLRQWLVQHKGKGPLFPPTKGRGRYMRKQTLYKHLREALAACELPVAMTWYQCTRHTFGSHWVMDGRPMEKLQQLLGHSSITVTERYAHLRPDIYGREDLAALDIDLSEPRCYQFKQQQGG